MSGNSVNVSVPVNVAKTSDSSIGFEDKAEHRVPEKMLTLPSIRISSSIPPAPRMNLFQARAVIDM